MNMNIKNKRRVMLIEPPFYRLYHDQQSFVKYPLPLGYLSSAVCKNTDWTVQTYNSDFNVKDQCRLLLVTKKNANGINNKNAKMGITSLIFTKFRSSFTKINVS